MAYCIVNSYQVYINDKIENASIFAFIFELFLKEKKYLYCLNHQHNTLYRISINKTIKFDNDNTKAIVIYATSFG